MAVRTHWTVKHACSHSVDHDLSNRPADKRVRCGSQGSRSSAQAMARK